MGHTERIRVVYADVDAMGHVNHAKYFTFMETARVFYYQKLAGQSRLEDLDIIVAKATCEFLRDLVFAQELEVTVWASHVGSTSFAFSYALLNQSKEWVARGETVQVSYDYARRSKKPIPEPLRSRLLEEMREGSGLPSPT